MLGYWGYSSGGSWWGLLIGILFLVLIISVIVSLMGGHRHGRWHHYNDRYGSERQNALDILRERYARGEIDKTEYEQKKADLMR
jgi:putative membrane protein